MRARIVRIGNSRGIRIPKPVLDDTGLDGEVELRVAGQAIVLEPVPRPRAGWADAFRERSDGLVDGDRPPSGDLEDGPWL